MKIGLNEAIVLQQLHYWLRIPTPAWNVMVFAGFITQRNMAGTVPILVRVNVKARVCKSKTLGLLRCEKLNKSKRDMTNSTRSTMGASF